MRLVSLFTRHATAAKLLMILVVAFGLYATTQIRAQFMPDVVSEEVEVSVEWENASAEDVSKSIVGVVSPNLMSVDGVTEISASAREGRARFRLTFEPDWDMAKALSDVESAMPSGGSLPDGAEDPEISEGGWRERVFNMIVSGDYPAARMEEVGDALKQELLRAGITNVSLQGMTTPEITVEVSAARLAEHGLTLSGLAQTIASQSRGNSVGDVGSGTPVRVGSDSLSLEGLSGMTVATEKGAEKLSDLATFSVTEAGSGRAYYLAGRQAVTIVVERGATGDSIKIHDTALAVANAFVDDRPEDLHIDLMRNEAADIKARLEILVDNALTGLVLVLVLLFVFLSPSAAVWVSAGIPISMAAGIGLMWATGQTLNIISVFALLICLGIIVDDAIVVAESAEHRRRNLGEGRQKASERAARRMLVPILGSTVTTVVAFMSLQFIGGRFGEFIATIPFVVAVVLAASLMECFFILPHHLAHGLSRLDSGWLAWPSRKTNEVFDRLRDRLFKPVIEGIVELRYPILILAVGATLQAVAMISNRDVSWRFFDAPQDPTMSANIAMRDEATRADTRAMLDELLRAASAAGSQLEAEYGTDPVKTVLTEIGGSAGRGLATADDKDEDLLGALTIELIEADERPYDTDTFVRAFEKELKKPELLETFSFRSFRRGPGGDGLDIALFGYDAGKLDQAAEELKLRLAEIPEVTGLEDDLTTGSASLVLSLSPMGEAMGFDEADIASELKARLDGVEATTFQSGTQTASIRVELPEGAVSEAFLEEILLKSPQGRWAELGEIVTATSDATIKSIRSQAGQAVVRVTGEISAQDGQRSEDIMRTISEDILPRFAADRGLSFELMGLSQQEQEFLSDALVGYAICLLLIYMTLTLVLGHWFQPMSIMAVIPVGITGVVWGHLWWDIPLSIFSIVGFVGMSGIIVNDSIVLVTAIAERLKTSPARQAIVEATSERLRPVLLTTLTTVLGLAPLLFETSSQAEFLKPMVVTLCFGMTFGFFIVLMAVPALVAIQDDVSRGMNALSARAGRPMTKAS